MTALRPRPLVAAVAAGLLLWLSGTAHAQDGGGVRTGDGEQLQGEAQGGRTQVQARFQSLCDALRAAARKPGREYTAGDLKFKGHAPWVAELICQYILAADQQPGALPPRFDDTAERRRFVATVLDAIQQHAGLASPAIDRDRILVGETMFRLHNRLVPGEAPERADPEAVPSMDMARSMEQPDALLLGINRRYFRGGGEKPLEWIEAGESFVLRVHALAEAGRIVIDRGLDWPVADMGTTVQDQSRRFAQAHSLLNTDARALWRETQAAKGRELSDEDRKRESETNRARNDPSHVELSIARREVPVPGAEGLSLFEYAPMPGAERPNGNNPRAWYIETLASATGGAEPGGITLPMWRLEPLAGESVAFPDRLFDETTRAPVETRFSVLAFCVVRIHYYTLPPGQRSNTAMVRDHELHHFDGIRDAWVERTRALRAGLDALAQDLNERLGLVGDAGFRVEVLTITDAFRADPKERITVLPEGMLVRSSTAYLYHANPAIQQLRVRVMRRIRAEESGATLLELLASRRPLDPKFAEAKALWEAWFKDHWHEYRNRFVREFLLAALRLDAREGAIGPNGQAGRPEYVAVAEAFAQATDSADETKAKRDPLKVLEQLLARAGIR
jgi:hypothetical protein